MWEIYAYQNADSLFGIFNAAATIHGSGDYMAAVAAVAFCGFIAALVAYAFAPEKLQGWKWLATVLLVFSVLIVPRVTVGVVDKTGGSAVKVVANVPFGVAFLGSVTSTVGHTLTGLFETAFQVIPGVGALPSELSYEKNGLMFGNRLIRETGGVAFQDPNFRTDLVNFIHNCTMYDLIDGTVDPGTFSSSDDVWALMASPNPARFTTLTSAGGSITVDTCPNAYTNLNGRLPAQLTRIQGKLAFQLNPTLPAAAANSAIAGQIQQAYLKNSIATAAATAADLIRQNAVLNAINDTSNIIGQKVNDPAAMVLAVGRAQSVAQQNAAWLNAGKVAEQALPVFRNVIEAITYALFPLLVLLMLLTSGRETMLAFKGYAAVLIWIQLWPPLYAVLNYMASIYAAYDLAAAADLGSGAKALSLQTASTIYSRAISGEAVVGYLAISIPFIAWAALKRMETFGTALVGGLSGLQSMVAGATAGAAAGNLSMGNVSMDQIRLAPNRTSAFMSNWQNDISGNTFSSNMLTGRTAVSLLRNQGYASRVVSMRVSEQDVQDASRQVDAARSEAVAASTERSAVLSEAFTKGLAKLKSSRSSTGSTSSSFEQLGQTLNRLDQITRSVADSTGMSQSQVARIAFGASGHLGVSTPVAGARATANAEKGYLAGLSADQQRVLGALTSEQLAEFKQFGDRVSRDSSFASVVASDAREARELSSRLNSSSTRSSRAEAGLSDRSAYAERVSAAYERGEVIALDIAQDPHNLAMFTRYAEQYGGTSAAARALMEAELARQSLGPNRTLSDGTAVPLSFESVRTQHARQVNQLAEGPDIESVKRTGDAAVARQPGLPSGAVPPPSAPGTVRDAVSRRGQAIRETDHERTHSMRKLLAGLTAMLLIAPGAASAQAAYPSKPIRIVVPFPAGGVADIVARTIGTRLAENIGQAVLVENRAGASAIIGTDFVAKSVPDGYTLLLANLPVMAINPIAYTKLPYDPLKDFAPISMVTDQPYIIAINPSIPAKDLNEFITLARQKKGEFSHGSASSSTHLASELFKIRAGIDALHVPYKGSAPAVNDLLGGQISFLIDPVITLQPFVKSGKVRALAVTDTKRSAAVPDVPSYTEFGLKDLNMTSWQGLVAPAGTSKEIIAKLHREIVKVLQSPEVIERMRAQGMTPVGNSPQEFTAFVQKEVERWSKVAADVKFERQSL